MPRDTKGPGVAQLPSGTVTFLFTDVEGSTRLLNQLGTSYVEVLSEHHRILRTAFAAHGGREVDNQGDSFFVVFQTAKDAVAAAVDAQRAFFAHPWPAGAEVRVRMGLHTGEPQLGDERYVGIGVHRAARIGAAGHGGQVLLSSTTKELAEEGLPAGVAILDLGERRLKDLERPERLFQLVIDGLPRAFGPLKTLDVELRRKRRRTYAGAALIGVLAAAVAIPVFALGQGGSGGSPTVSGNAVAIIDPASNRVSGQVPVGIGPAALAVAGGSLWVANTDDQSVSHIDLADSKVVGNVPVGGVPTSVAVGPGAVWVAVQRPGGLLQIVKVDPRFNLVGKTRTVEGDAFGDASVAAAGRGVWVASQGGLLERLDSAGNAADPSIDTGNSPSSVAVGAGGVWIADAGANNVARVDPATNLLVATTAVGNQPDAVAAGLGALWVADAFDDAVVRVDPATNSATETIPVGRSPTGIAVGLGSVWVANSADGTVSRIDPRRGIVVKTIRVGGSPQSIAVGGGRVWVSVQNTLVVPGHRAGGVAHITEQYPIDSLDPAQAYGPLSWEIEDATCAKLMNYADRPAPAGSRLEPEVATALPIPTDGGKTYTFTIRRGFRFSPPSNAPVTAQTFKSSIERSLSPKLKGGPAGQYAGDIVGAPAYMAGKAKHISGVSVHGNKLTVRLTNAAPDLLSRLATPFFCAVPPGTPAEGAPGVNSVPSAGPYYVASYNPKQGVILKRNPNYHGSRPHTLDEIDVTIHVGSEQSFKEVEAGTSDFAASGIPAAKVASVAARYGVGSPAARAGGRRYFVNPELGLWYLALNTSRPLFKDVNLRRAVNYALDRRALAKAAQANSFPGQPTDQYLPPGFLGYRAVHAYPLTPDLARAKQLARGHGGPAVLYVCDEPFCHAVAQLIQAELAPLGISVEIKAFDISLLFARVGTRGEPFDMSLGGWAADYPDPSSVLNTLFDGRSIAATGNNDITYFNDPAYNRRLAAAARLSGLPRDLAYQALDADLTRKAAPGAPLFDDVSESFFSARVGSGCKIYQPVYGIDLAALCLTASLDRAPDPEAQRDRKLAGMGEVVVVRGPAPAQACGAAPVSRSSSCEMKASQTG